MFFFNGRQSVARKIKWDSGGLRFFVTERCDFSFANNIPIVFRLEMLARVTPATRTAPSKLREERVCLHAGEKLDGGV